MVQVSWVKWLSLLWECKSVVYVSLLSKTRKVLESLALNQLLAIDLV